MDGFLPIFLTASLGILAVCMAFSLARAIIGPTITDRMIGVNMINTQVMLFLLALCLYLGEGFIVDVALVYAMIGFLSVVVFAKVYIGADLERQAKGEEPVVPLKTVPEPDKLAGRKDDWDPEADEEKPAIEAPKKVSSAAEVKAEAPANTSMASDAQTVTQTRVEGNRQTDAVLEDTTAAQPADAPQMSKTNKKTSYDNSKKKNRKSARMGAKGGK